MSWAKTLLFFAKEELHKEERSGRSMEEGDNWFVVHFPGWQALLPGKAPGLFIGKQWRGIAASPPDRIRTELNRTETEPKGKRESTTLSAFKVRHPHYGRICKIKHYLWICCLFDLGLGLFSSANNEEGLPLPRLIGSEQNWTEQKLNRRGKEKVRLCLPSK